MIYLNSSMGEQRKQSLISAQINQEPGVEMTPLKTIFAENLSLKGKETCHHRLLVLCDMSHLYVGKFHILDFLT